MTTLLIDNWLLQDVNQALEQGLSEDNASEIKIDSKNDTHDFRVMPQAVFQLDALLSLLVNIVLRDQLIVDDRFTYVWDGGHKSLKTLKTAGVLSPFDFLTSEDLIAGPRKTIVDELCVTSSILAAQKANERSWEELREPKDNYMSSLVWGTAGYLARSHVYKTPYLGSPYRQALIRQTEVVLPKMDAVDNVENIITSKRAKMFRSLAVGRNATFATFNLPPIAIEIIRDSKEPGQLFEVALQLRDKYKELREWLGEYQKALDSENPKTISKHVRLLESIAKEMDSKFKSGSDDATNLTVGTNWLSLKIPITNIIEKVRDQFGVRAMFSHMVLSYQGRESLSNLLAMFGEKNTQFSMTTFSELVTRYS